MEISALPIIEENDRFLSTITTSSQCNTEVATLERPPADTDAASTRSSETVIADLLHEMLVQIDESNTLPTAPCEEREESLKSMPRTLRSRIKGRWDASNGSAQDRRRVSNRKRAWDQKPPLDPSEKRARTKTASECSNANETSSNSDDQTSENLHEKTVRSEETLATGDEESNSSHSTTKAPKSVPSQIDAVPLPPNKRRLRERNTGLSNPSPTEENAPVEPTARNIPKNGIKQFLNIRQQVRAARRQCIVSLASCV